MFSVYVMSKKVITSDVEKIVAYFKSFDLPQMEGRGFKSTAYHCSLYFCGIVGNFLKRNRVSLFPILGKLAAYIDEIMKKKEIKLINE